MNKTELDQYIIDQYQNDEEMMIVIFAQWCVNHNLDARELYKMAYPAQQENQALIKALENTVPKEDAEEISHETVQQVLQLFGNDDLAFIVQQMMDQTKK